MSVSIYVFLWDVSQRLLLMAKKPIRSRIRSPIPIWKILRCLCSGCQIAVRNFRGIHRSHGSKRGGAGHMGLEATNGNETNPRTSIGEMFLNP